MPTPSCPSTLDPASLLVLLRPLVCEHLCSVPFQLYFLPSQLRIPSLCIKSLCCPSPLLPDCFVLRLARGLLRSAGESHAAGRIGTCSREFRRWLSTVWLWLLVPLGSRLPLGFSVATVPKLSSNFWRLLLPAYSAQMLRSCCGAVCPTCPRATSWPLVSMS